VLINHDPGAMRQDKEHIFRKAYDERFKSLVIYSAKLGVPSEHAKDIVQECFIKLWENFSRIDAPLPYLFKSVRNSSLSYLVSHESKIYGKTVPLPAIGHKGTHDEEERKAMEYFHKVEEAYRRLMSLTGRCRDAFTMVYVHRMKIKEAAEEMNVSENTLKTYLKRAKDYLQKL